MSKLIYTKPEKVSIKSNPEFNEKWIQEIIADDPSVLGLGDLVLKDKERIQPRAGRLDLLLQDAFTNRRYEVELQLGKTDESHIIRTIEYWDIERKRYPMYDHCAVIVAEDITSRFLSVISLFNGFIPLIAIQMNAFKVGENISVVFTKVLDEMSLGLVDEDEETQEVTDRSWWEQKRGTKTTVSMVDDFLEIAKGFDNNLELKYNKFYIGLAKNGQPNNFVIFRPQRNAIRFEPRLDKNDEIEEMLDSAGLDLLDYDTKWRRYRIRLTKDEIKKHRDLLTKLSELAFNNSSE